MKNIYDKFKKYTISKALQFLSQPEELHVKLKTRIAKFCNSGCASP